MKVGYKSMKCGLIGEHLGHSFSPMIHSEIADYTYELRELTPSEVAGFVREGDLDAFNVTIPYKKAVMPYLDEISPEAERIGAVNTVVRKNGKIVGYNTDYYGFCGMLDMSGIDPRGKKAIILGNGGASLTVRAALSDRGAKEIVVVDIGLENNYNNIDRHFDSEIIVNATPVGMYPNNGKSLVSVGAFKNCCGVLDVIYNPYKTALLLDAEHRGIKHINGLYMLVCQAVKAFEFFTGDTAEEGICARITEKIERQTKNIVLIGMPGCGKSTVGRLIAEKIGRELFDSDEEFAKMHGMTPAEAINTLGEDKFREMEHLTLCKLCKESSTVIATGGGAVTREYNYDILRQNSTVVYLKRELSRLPTGGRPLSQREGVAALFEARRPLYERFAHITAESTETPEKTARLILSELGF